MTMMLAPDLLDRRALALLALIDGAGRPVRSRVLIEGDGLRSVAKPDGRVALLEAAGFEAYAASFLTTPAAPLVSSQQLALDLTPMGGALLPRRVVLALPRNPDPAAMGQAASLFQPVTVQMSPSPRATLDANAAIVRASVRRAGDGAMIENALVRARSADGAFTAWALTDPAGEAALVFPALPIAFAGAGGATLAMIAVSVLVDVDPAQAGFAQPATLAAARSAANARRRNHADPDAIALAHPPDFTTGTTIQLGAGREAGVSLQWSQP